MFSHKNRYLFILGLTVYTYLNTVLCEVYTYFDIAIEWYYAFGTIALITGVSGKAAGCWNHCSARSFTGRKTR